jgi:hypothetical protein
VILIWLEVVVIIRQRIILKRETAPSAVTTLRQDELSSVRNYQIHVSDEILKENMYELITAASRSCPTRSAIRTRKTSSDTKYLKHNFGDSHFDGVLVQLKQVCFTTPEGLIFKPETTVVSAKHHLRERQHSMETTSQLAAEEEMQRSNTPTGGSIKRAVKVKSVPSQHTHTHNVRFIITHPTLEWRGSN